MDTKKARRRISVFLTERCWAALADLARETGASRTQLVRVAIRFADRLDALGLQTTRAPFFFRGKKAPDEQRQVVVISQTDYQTLTNMAKRWGRVMTAELRIAVAHLHAAFDPVSKTARVVPVDGVPVTFIF